MRFNFKIILLVHLLQASVVLCAPFQADEFLLPGWSISAGMGNMRVMVPWGALSSSANPALLRFVDGIEIAASGGSSFQGLVSSGRAGVAWSRGAMAYGITVSTLGGGDIPITELPQPDEPLSAENRPYIVRMESHHTVLLDIAAERDYGKFTAGLSLKGVYKKIPELYALGFSLSGGILCKPIGNLGAGLFLENLSTYHLFWNDGLREVGMPRAGCGLSYELHLSDRFNVLFAAEGDYSIDAGSGAVRVGARCDYAGVIAFALGTDNSSLCSGANVSIGDRFSAGANISYNTALGTSYNISMSYRIAGE